MIPTTEELKRFRAMSDGLLIITIKAIELGGWEPISQFMSESDAEARTVAEVIDDIVEEKLAEIKEDLQNL